MMADTIEIPHLGSFKKNQVIAVGGVAGGIVVYAWWRARGHAPTVDAAEAPEPVDPFEGSFGTNGGVGAVSGYPDRGSDTTTTAPRTNAEWSQLAAEKLADSYDPNVINAALGRFLGRQPLSSLDQEVVRAAIARAGYPPEGSYTVISGGNTDITVAPGGVTARAGGPTYATVSWSAVAGAGTYYVYREGTARPTVAKGTSLQWSGLPAGGTVKFAVSAVSASGKEGPRSGWVSVKLPVPKLTAPSGLRVVQVTRTEVRVTYRSVPGAAGYIGFRTGAYVGVAHSQDTNMTIGGLQPGHRYTISVAARTGVGEAVGPKASISVTTKK